LIIIYYFVIIIVINHNSNRMLQIIARGDTISLGKIEEFLDERDKRALPCICKVMKLRVHLDPYPFSYLSTMPNADCLSIAKQLLALTPFSTPFLRQADETGQTPTWHAYRRQDHRVVELFQSQGGLLATSDEQRKILAWSPCYFFEHPRLSFVVREAKWNAATDVDIKNKLLQRVLVEACRSGSLGCIRWVMKKQKEQEKLPPLELTPALYAAVYSGFVMIVKELFTHFDASKLPQDVKERVVRNCVLIGYPELLSFFKQHGFPVSEEQEIGMRNFVFIHQHLSMHAKFPVPLNVAHKDVHGGDDNMTIAQREYEKNVALVYHWLFCGYDFRLLIDVLLFRRHRMAVLGGLTMLHLYGTATDSQVITDYRKGSTYGSYGDRIRDRFAENFKKKEKVQAIAVIQGETVPLTTLEEGQWEHPDGTHREKVLQEVTRICEENFRTFCADQSKFGEAIGRIVYLISHMPPCKRGTPIVLRSLIDGICLWQLRWPIESHRELNCITLTHITFEAFMEENGHLLFKIPFLPDSIARKGIPFSLEGNLGYRS